MTMDMSPVAVIAAIALGLSGSAAQTPDTGGRPPSAKHEAIVVRGCVSGPLLRELRVQKSHMPSEAPETAVVYRLTGEKKLLQLIRKEHEDQLLDVAGEITSNGTGTVRIRGRRQAGGNGAGKARVLPDPPGDVLRGHPAHLRAMRPRGIPAFLGSAGFHRVLQGSARFVPPLKDSEPRPRTTDGCP